MPDKPMDSGVRAVAAGSVVLASAEAMRQGVRRAGRLKGRQVQASALADVRALLGEAPLQRDLLIEYLHRLNDTWHALYERHLVALASAMRVSMAEVFEVATFYHHFAVLPDDAPVASVTVRVCDGLSCSLAGAAELLERLPTLLASRADVRVVAAPCVGRCEQAPVAVVHQNPLPQATPQAVLRCVEAGQTRHPAATDDAPSRALCAAAPGMSETGALESTSGVAPPYAGYAAYRATGGYQLLRSLVDGTQSAESVLEVMEASALRGLGGAGFPTGRKWRIVRAQAAPRLMAVNIDEGEPGTFKDRTYLERDPHRFLEGVLVAARVVGIDTCYLYVRDEYHGCRAILETELERLRADPPCALPNIMVRRGAGAYICGEESAMLESIEGKRGEPRMRPPYIAQVGLFGRPTLEHNFETLFWVRDLVQQGAAWFSSYGRNGRHGLRSYSVSGRVRLPGVKLASAGISLQELIVEYCGGMLPGHTLYAYLPGGASGGIFPASLAHVALDFDTLQPYGGFIGSAAVIVLSQFDRARDAARTMMQFFADESCGQCTPCRVGTSKAVVLMDAPQWDLATLEDLNTVMGDASICGLGQAAPNPVRCVVQYFPHEVR